MGAINRNDAIVNVLTSILMVLVVGGAALSIYFTYKNCEAQQNIVNGYVIDKNMTAAYTEQRMYYNGIAYYITHIHHPASYTFTIQSDEDSELTATYSVSAEKYEIHNIGDYIENINEVLILRKD